MNTTIIPVSSDFNQRLSQFMDRFGTLMNPVRVSYEMGTKYAKIISGLYGNQHIHAYLDFSGNLYHPATERMPKRPPFSSMYNDDFGLTNIDKVGISYVR